MLSLLRRTGVVFLFLLLAPRADAQTPAQIRATADTWLANRWTAVQAMEAAYLAAHGRYFQGLWTHTVPPADGLSTTADNLLVTPSTQPERWDNVLTLPATLPCRVRIDVYDGPQGKGYIATIQVTIAGQRWTRSAQVGPEARWTSVWLVIP